LDALLVIADVIAGKAEELAKTVTGSMMVNGRPLSRIRSVRYFRNSFTIWLI
jgi:hypothetical protein